MVPESVGGLGATAGMVVRWPDRQAGEMSKFSDILVHKSCARGVKIVLARAENWAQRCGTTVTLQCTVAKLPQELSWRHGVSWLLGPWSGAK